MTLYIVFKDGTSETISNVSEYTTWLDLAPLGNIAAKPEFVIHFKAYVAGPRYIALDTVHHVTARSL